MEHDLVEENCKIASLTPLFPGKQLRRSELFVEPGSMIIKLRRCGAISFCDVPVPPLTGLFLIFIFTVRCKQFAPTELITCGHRTEDITRNREREKNMEKPC